MTTSYIPYTGVKRAVISDTEGVGVPVHEQAGLDILTAGTYKFRYANGEVGFRTFADPGAFDVRVMQIYATGTTASMSVDILLR